MVLQFIEPTNFRFGGFGISDSIISITSNVLRRCLYSLLRPIDGSNGRENFRRKYHVQRSSIIFLFRLSCNLFDFIQTTQSEISELFEAYGKLIECRIASKFVNDYISIPLISIDYLDDHVTGRSKGLQTVQSRQFLLTT